MPNGNNLQEFLWLCGEQTKSIISAPLSSNLYFQVSQVEIPDLLNLSDPS